MTEKKIHKKTHFGRAGEFFAMSEVLLRGWNVAVPVVDVGDDVLIIDDNDKTTLRVQVKSSRVNKDDKVQFTLSRKQLRSDHPVELVYMLMLREAERWRFLVIPRQDLWERHREYLSTPGRRGRNRSGVGLSASSVDANPPV
ncbi:MAG: hypothetical protein HC927_13855 [Deltaproteobacteria bacterium]|nr:hypothetical protein [Deltaproteobacteria bacterium]